MSTITGPEDLNGVYPEDLFEYRPSNDPPLVRPEKREDINLFLLWVFYNARETLDESDE